MIEIKLEDKNPREITRREALSEFDLSKVTYSSSPRSGGYTLHLASHLDVTGVGGTELEARERLIGNWEDRRRRERELDIECAALDIVS